MRGADREALAGCDGGGASRPAECQCAAAQNSCAALDRSGRRVLDADAEAAGEVALPATDSVVAGDVVPMPKLPLLVANVAPPAKVEVAVVKYFEPDAVTAMLGGREETTSF